MNTKANVGKPPKKNSLLNQLTERPPVVADNMEEKILKDLNFKVDEQFHQHFKMLAVRHNLSMKRLLQEAVDCWVEKKERNS